MRTMRKTFYVCVLIIFVIASLLSVSCRHGASSDDDTPDTTTYRPLPTPGTEFEQKLKEVRDTGKVVGNERIAGIDRLFRPP